jgi:hypothetical protein
MKAASDPSASEIRPIPSHRFTLVLSGASEITEEVADALFEAGCDDASPASCNGVVSVDFDREAESLGDAIGSAVKAVERAGYAVARVDVEEGRASRDG